MSDNEPKRIYGWQASQLSIARHFGGITINGVLYTIRYDLPGEPLEEIPERKPVKRKKKAKAKAESTIFEVKQ